MLRPAPAGAQSPVPGTYGAETRTEDENEATDSQNTELSYREVYRLLLDRGLTEEAAARLLRDYPVEKSFSETEVQEILRRVRPEDLKTRRGLDEKEPEEEPLAITRTVGPGEASPFGYELFKHAPDTFEPDQDLAVGSDYRVGPGDELRISLWGSVQQEFFAVIDREGNVTLPEVGVLQVAGMTLGALEERLNQELRKAFSGFKLAVSLRRLRRIQVVVAGEVTRPGAYFLSPVSTTFNALYYAGGPTSRGTLRQVRVVRDGVVVAEVDLYDYLLTGNTSGDVKLQSGDTVFILPKGREVTIRGEVDRPAIFELLKGETVADLVRMGGGFTPTAHVSRATLDRVSPVTGPITLELDLSGILDGSDPDGGSAVPLQDGDNLMIYSIYHVEPRQFVEVQGMVQYPGIYPLYPGARVSDVVFRAGGLLDSAFRLKAELSRVSPSTLTRTAITDTVSQVLYIDLDKALTNPSDPENMTLVKDDKLYVRKIPGWKLQETVRVTGEVPFPGIYPLRIREERLSSVVSRAGGLTRESFLKGASLFRKEQGRVIISFDKALKDPGGREDVALIDGDSIHVPAYPPTILVEGEVSRPGALLYHPGKSARYYLEQTGGPTDAGDKGETRIIRVDGVVQKAHRDLWWDPTVQPGSRIIVPKKPEGKGINWGTVVKDTTTILASLATTVFIVTQIDKN